MLTAAIHRNVDMRKLIWRKYENNDSVISLLHLHHHEYPILLNPAPPIHLLLSLRYLVVVTPLLSQVLHPLLVPMSKLQPIVQPIVTNPVLVQVLLLVLHQIQDPTSLLKTIV